MEIKAKIKDIVSEISNIEVAKLKDEIPVKQLGLDSLDLAQIVFNIEEELDIKLQGEIELEELLEHTVGEFLDTLLKCSGKQDSPG